MVDNELMVMARFSRSLLLIASALGLSNACGQISYESQRQAMIDELRDESRLSEEYGAPPISERTLGWLRSERFRGTSSCPMRRSATRMKIGHCRSAPNRRFPSPTSSH